ncbi:hypothetical protein [Gemmatimonas sp.]|uniref:hypothetical protein n=1 Tax=Gemmatimonas sp. TaxID=1962908 RepID=UPI003983AFB3
MPTLAHATLAQYLNDHLAGSVAALKLMSRVGDARAKEPLGVLMSRLRADLDYEQGVLRELLGTLDAECFPFDIDFAGLASRHPDEREAARVAAGRAALCCAATVVSRAR